MAESIDLEAQHERGGYDLLGQLMGKAAETAIFRSFTALSAENILYLQAELISLETDWRETQAVNKVSQDRTKSSRLWNWDELRNSGEDGNDDQWETVLQIRKLLKEYRKRFEPHSLYLSTDFRALIDAR